MAYCNSSGNQENGKRITGGVETNPRVITLGKMEKEVDFTVRDQANEDSSMKYIEGKLYGPLQKIWDAAEEDIAEIVGLREGERIIEINGINVEEATEEEVADLIRSHTGYVTFAIISYQEELESLNFNNYSYIDNSDKVTFPISIPDYNWSAINGKRFIAYKIYIAERYVCSRRYREFRKLHENLKKIFPEFHFLKLPKKRLLPLSDKKIDARRIGLENYLRKICALSVIVNTEIVQQFIRGPEA